jgi:hypothetical protein
MHSYCYVMYSYLYVYVFLILLCMLVLGNSVSLCCSMYRFCVDVYCATATGCQQNCSYQIYHTISYHIISIITAIQGSTRLISSGLNSLGLKIKELFLVNICYLLVFTV